MSDDSLLSGPEYAPTPEQVNTGHSPDARNTMSQPQSVMATLPPEVEARLRRYELQTKGLLLAAGIFIGAIGHAMLAPKSESVVVSETPVAAQQAPAQDPQAGGPPPQPMSNAATVTSLSSLRGSTTIGDPKAKAVIYEFTDMQCPACASAARTFMPDVMNRFVTTGKARLVLLHWPLPIHPNAPAGSRAVLCAAEKGKSTQVYNAVFERQNEWAQLSDGAAKTKLVEIGTSFGLSKESFGACVNSTKYDAEMRLVGEAAARVGAPGTPTFFINGARISSPQQFEQMITDANR